MYNPFQDVLKMSPPCKEAWIEPWTAVECLRPRCYDKNGLGLALALIGYLRKLTKFTVLEVETTNHTVVLCDTHDTTILIVDRRYRRYLRDDTTAVYRSSKKHRETAQVS